MNLVEGIPFLINSFWFEKPIYIARENFTGKIY